MLDVILIQNGRAHEIWRGKTLDELRPLYHADLIAQMVERTTGTVNDGDVWDEGTQTFSAPAP